MNVGGVRLHGDHASFHIRDEDRDSYDAGDRLGIRVPHVGIVEYEITAVKPYRFTGFMVEAVHRPNPNAQSSS